LPTSELKPQFFVSAASREALFTAPNGEYLLLHYRLAETISSKFMVLFSPSVQFLQKRL